jgi:hypothetical protein
MSKPAVDPLHEEMVAHFNRVLACERAGRVHIAHEMLREAWETLCDKLKASKPAK